jgi:branched-chain amino acid transport system substrate-binding protein
VQKWRAKFPDEKYVNQVGEDAYLGVLLYVKAVELAKTTKQDAVTAALESENVCVDAPEGHVCVDPKSHHLTHSVSLMEVQSDHSVKQLKVFSNVEPYWLGQAGCDLPKHPDHEQYTPSNPPTRK